MPWHPMLQTLNEYIKDTEDLVNIKLDQHRNQLITTDLILTALTCALAIVTTVAGIFGMNLDSGLQVRRSAGVL
jgi:magnesium transporter